MRIKNIQIKQIYQINHHLLKLKSNYWFIELLLCFLWNFLRRFLYINSLSWKRLLNLISWRYISCLSIKIFSQWNIWSSLSWIIHICSWYSCRTITRLNITYRLLYWLAQSWMLDKLIRILASWWTYTKVSISFTWTTWRATRCSISSDAWRSWSLSKCNILTIWTFAILLIGSFLDLFFFFRPQEFPKKKNLKPWRFHLNLMLASSGYETDGFF